MVKRLTIKAKPGADKAEIEKLDESSYVVSVREPPVRGLANAAIISALAEYFGVARSRVTIVSGWTSRQKIVQISEP